jgi:hypothetical protein
MSAGGERRRGHHPGRDRSMRAGDDMTRKGAKAMASTQMYRVDAYGLLPSILIVLMLILAILGVVAHAAAL